MQPLLSLSSRFRHVTLPAERQRTRPALRVDTRDTRVEAPPSDEFDEGTAFCRWLLRRAGLPGDAYRPETLRRRLPACLRAVRARRLDEARATIACNPSELALAVSALLVGVTSFFRDRPVFDVLKEEIAQSLSRRESIHAWSAGCSDGQELYSVAMLLDDAGALGKGYLFGTDCRNDAIAHARRGVYSAQEVESVGPDVLARHFVRENGEYRLRSYLTQAARFRVSDLLGPCEPGVWDLILCRNATMYMHPHATSRLWARFEASLRVGGLLVLGKAERPAGTRRLVSVVPSVYRRVRG